MINICLLAIGLIALFFGIKDKLKYLIVIGAVLMAFGLFSAAAIIFTCPVCLNPRLKPPAPANKSITLYIIIFFLQQLFAYIKVNSFCFTKTID